MLCTHRDGSVTREQIISVFWPESETARARNALRQTLSFVRACVGDDAVTSVGSYGLSVSPDLNCDTVQFEALLDAGQKEEALQLYRGQFLQAFHVTGCAGFAEWVDDRRQHLAHRAAKAAWDLSGEREIARDTRGAAFWGKRALSLSPFSESEVQRLLRLLDRLGDYAEALRAYEGLVTSLRAEFNVEPSAETMRLASAIRRRLELDASPSPEADGRRSSDDRRGSFRRGSEASWNGAERRRYPDRRQGNRRAADDRRMNS